jgi:hypothetical protein
MAPPRAVTLLVALLAALPERGRGPGQLVTPRPRNSIDFDDPRIPAKLRTTWAWCQNITGAPCNNGQTAYWYSQGCYIGCAQCDHVSGRRQVDLCGKGLVGMLPDESVSVNREHATGASRNGKLDIYRHNPWRAPGHAPVADACGLAGGTPWKDLAPEEGRYITTAHAHHGMNGTDLPEMPTGTVWKAGGTADVAWQVRYNHGGGYAYRLCPASENLTEACFQKHPMDFVRDRHALLLGDGTKIPIAGVFTNTGPSPLHLGSAPHSRWLGELDATGHARARPALQLRRVRRRHTRRLQLRLPAWRGDGRLPHAGELLGRGVRALPRHTWQRLQPLRQPRQRHLVPAARGRRHHGKAASGSRCPQGADAATGQVHPRLSVRLRPDRTGLVQLRRRGDHRLTEMGVFVGVIINSYTFASFAASAGISRALILHSRGPQYSALRRGPPDQQSLVRIRCSMPRPQVMRGC